MPEAPECTSRNYWWPTIISMAKNFEKVLIEDLEFVQLDTKKLKEALQLYERGWWSFKEQIYKKKAKAARIDMHKIIAIYILSFLKTEPFRACIPETEDDDKEIAFLANEYFCLDIMRALISSCANRSEAFQMSENDKNWFIILLNNLKLKHEELNTQIISPDRKSDMVDVLSLAQIIYYIEKSYIG
jgi:hypothetical protein